MSAEQRATPGPRNVVELLDVDVYGNLIVTAKGVGDICHVFQNDDEPDDEAKANAALLSAAPDLLAALLDIVWHCDLDTEDDRYRINASAALKKAGVEEC